VTAKWFNIAAQQVLAFQAVSHQLASEEARTRGFPSPSFDGFGFIVVVI
jgi:hypothetical protein